MPRQYFLLSTVFLFYETARWNFCHFFVSKHSISLENCTKWRTLIFPYMIYGIENVSLCPRLFQHQAISRPEKEIRSCQVLWLLVGFLYSSLKSVGVCSFCPRVRSTQENISESLGSRYLLGQREILDRSSHVHPCVSVWGMLLTHFWLQQFRCRLWIWYDHGKFLHAVWYENGLNWSKDTPTFNRKLNALLFLELKLSFALLRSVLFTLKTRRNRPRLH